MEILSKWEGKRRLYITILWAFCNYAAILLQPILKLDASLILSVLEKSTYVAVVAIVGLSGTNLMDSWSGKKNGGNGKSGGANVSVATTGPEKKEG